MPVPDRHQMNKLWEKIAPQSDKPQSSMVTNSDYMTLVEARMKETGESKAMSMRAVTAKYPEKHAIWLQQVQK